MPDDHRSLRTEGKPQAEESSPFRAPAISQPKGGGAIRGIGEKFAANPVTGTGSMSVPIATSPGRSGFGLQLSLSYDSGAGNGPFGFGWSLSLPSITRKTDKGLPKYQDTVESDAFLLSGAEDLVPVLPDVVPPRTVNSVTYGIQRYRPRIEGLFARIERWTNQIDPKDSFWRSISKDNITTWYGKTKESRIFDPADPLRIFSWLICESYDDKGNVIAYRYKEESSDNIDASQGHERNRTAATRKANRYLKRIRYGNHAPYLPKLLADQPWPTLPGDDKWLFEAVFDYGEHYTENPQGQPTSVHIEDTNRQWSMRPDPFSSYRAGFEVRIYRRCQRVLMFHRFSELGTTPCLVRSTDFSYREENSRQPVKSLIASFITSATQSGYLRKADGTYRKKSLPPVEFEYSEANIDETVRDVDASSLENLPIGVDGTAYQWIDLHGEGIPGILTEQAGAWFYKRNLSPISARPVEFAPLERVATKPNLALGGSAQFMDLAGDGQPDLVVLDGPMPGLYEHDEAESWQPFRPLTSRLNRDMRDPNLKFVDLDGDGHADVLITEDDAFVWHASLAEAGFGPARRVVQALDEEKGPRVVFADGTQSIYLADLSGDGLTDLVRIRNGEVCYWPNLGYGRFGAKVTMDRAPHFDNPDKFDHKRIRLADIDGSGTTDIIYLHRDGIRLYFNQSGNGWSAPQALRVFPRIDDVVSIVPTDLLGNGTACLVWSSPLPGDARRQMRYVDLMGGQKPHLLIKTVNNLGAETRVQYAPSTKFYLQDKSDGKPWITRLPFPVHVVEKVETYDHISRNRFVTRYAYHHGYFDGEEREFRGFGMVEQFDTEEFAALSASDAFPVGDNVDAASHVPPVHTKSWFHTGVYLGRDHVSNYFAGLLDNRDVGEYYPQFRSGDATADAATKVLLLDDTILPTGLTLDEEREACRALKGAMLRQEVYALDGTDKAQHPYTVTEQNFTIERLQPKGDNRHGVFFTHAREAISYHYERNPADPHVVHTLTLEVDKYGNVLKSVAIGYGRRQGLSPLQGEDKKKQEQTFITYTENDVTNAIDKPTNDPGYDPDNYRTPLPCEARTYEVSGLLNATDSNRFAFDEILGECNGAALLDYEKLPTQGQKQKRLIEHVRTQYRLNDCGVAQNNPLALLPLATLESLALPGESYKLAFSPGLAKQVYVDSGKLLQADLNAVLANDGKYVHSEGDTNWWIPSGQMFYSTGSSDTSAQELAHARSHFFLPHRYRDPFHTNARKTETVVSYDTYALLVQETRDALDNTVKAQHDYRVLQPALVTDPNGNRSEARFDVLGMVAGTAVMGKATETLGDVLDASFAPDLTQAQLDAFMAKPREATANPDESVATQIVHDLLRKATTRIIYDLDRFKRSGEPPFAATIARETHVSALASGQTSKLQVSFSYSDGFGREIQKKIQAEPGRVPKRDAAGKIIVGPDGQPEMTTNDISPRWVGSGWTVFNNKGKPVRQYEPFFTDAHRFEFDVRIGVSPVLFYDPVERVVATLHPNHTWEKVVFDPWRQETWDVSDTVTLDPRSDKDVMGFFVKPDGTPRLPTADYLPTWHALRKDPAHAAEANQRWPDPKLREAEKGAAEKAAVHEKTPTVAHADSLGRTFLTVAHNKFKHSDTPPAAPPTEEFHRTRVELDIEGNQRAVRDAVQLAGDPQGRIVMRYDYDMLGNRIHQASMEAGERWMLNDVAGKPIRAWNSRGHAFRTTYDRLRRPTANYVRGHDTANPSRELLFEATVYGDRHPQAAALNLRGKPFKVFDSAGVVTSVRYDFKGNLRESARELSRDYKQRTDWSSIEPHLNVGPSATLNVNAVTQASALLLESTPPFTSSTTYDALNRPTELTTPDNSVIRPTYNEANLLERVEANLRGAATITTFVNDIDYNAKGQREVIEYRVKDNSGADKVVRTRYTYDRDTFRLTYLKTERPHFPSTERVLQDLHYTYDPAGNITHIRDDAQPKIYFNGQVVDPHNEYTYDAIYRLIAATGREHIGQAGQPRPYSYNDVPCINLAHPHDGQKMRNYNEHYDYDQVGNILHMIHSAASNGSWTRTYAYTEASLIESGRKSNRLSNTTVGTSTTEAYRYDRPDGLHGNMTKMPHLQIMEWDFEDQLRMTQRQAVNAEDEEGLQHQGEQTYYVYDAAGQRVRKVTEYAGTKKNERIYLGGFELYREHTGTNAGLVRETLHIMDDKQRIALVETRNNVDDGSPTQLIRFQFTNHLGTATLELNRQARVISYEEYSPYGSTTYQAVDKAIKASAKRYQYTGKERDEESGVYYHGARYYAPWLGRWASCDPAGMVDGVNIYLYAQLNPLANRDANGRQSRRVTNVSEENDVSRVKPTVNILDVAPGETRRAYPASLAINPGLVKALKELQKDSENPEPRPNAKFQTRKEHLMERGGLVTKHGELLPLSKAEHI